jgi:hypothetical protein
VEKQRKTVGKMQVGIQILYLAVKGKTYKPITRFIQRVLDVIKYVPFFLESIKNLVFKNNFNFNRAYKSIFIENYNTNYCYSDWGLSRCNAT